MVIGNQRRAIQVFNFKILKSDSKEKVTSLGISAMV